MAAENHISKRVKCIVNNEIKIIHSISMRGRNPSAVFVAGAMLDNIASVTKCSLHRYKHTIPILGSFAFSKKLVNSF